MLRITLLLTAWTTAIWANRLWNIYQDGSGDTIVPPIVFLTGSALLAGGFYIWSQNRIPTRWLAVGFAAFSGLSIGRWLTSVIASINGDNSGVFVGVHIVLALITTAICLKATQMIWKIDMSERKLQELST